MVAKKFQVRYKIDSVDYIATLEKIKKLGINCFLGGGRPSKGGEPTEAQITLNLKELDSKVLISPPSGKIQISYTSRKNLKKCVSILKKCCVQKNRERLDLICLGDEDPLDTSVFMKTIDHMEPKDTKYAIAVIKLYEWRDPKTDESIYRIANRENRVNIPGTSIRVKPENILIYTEQTPFVFSTCLPVGVHCINKEDAEGNRIITSERLRWSALKELRRITKAHPRFKPTKELIQHSILKDLNRPKEIDLVFVIGEPIKIKFNKPK